MKKLFLLSLVGLAICLFAVPAMADTQVLLNGGFENWSTNGVTGPPNNWFYRTIVPTVTADSATVRTGTYSARYYWNSTTTTKLTSDTINVIAGRVYTCTLWVSDQDTSGRVRPYFWFIPAGPNPSPTYSINVPGWQAVVFQATCPPGQYGLNMEVRGNQEAGRWDGDAVVYIDDMVLWEATPTVNQPPTIGTVYRTPSGMVTVGEVVKINANISDDTLVVKDSLFWNLNGGAFTQAGRDSLVGSTYWYNIPGHLAGDSISYRIYARDGSTPPLSSTSPTYNFVVVDTVMPFTPIAQVQYNVTNPGGTSPDTCYPSPIMGQTVKLSGIVTGVYQRAGYRSRFWMQDADTVWSGILVFQSSGPDSVLAGDSVTIIGAVMGGREYYGMTEIETPITITKHASGRPVPAPLQLTSAMLGRGGNPNACGPATEQYEGCFVELTNFTVTSIAGSAGYVKYWGNDGSGDSCALWNGIFFSGFDMPTITVGQLYTSVKGVVDYTFGDQAVTPRFSADVAPAATPPNITGITVLPSPMRPGQVVKLNATITTTGTIASDSLYYKLGAGAFTPVTHDSIAAGNVYKFHMGSYAIGDSITYHVVATDNIAQRTQTSDAFFVVPDTSFCGVDSIYNVQYTLNGGVDSTCFPSPKDGLMVNICGIVTAVRQGTYKDVYMVDSRTPGGPSTNWTAITLYDFVAGTSDTLRAVVGDKLEVNGRVKEYYGITEIDSLVSYTVRGSSNVFDTTHVHVTDLGGSCNFGSEAYENVLVRMDSVTVLSAKGATGFWIKDNSSTDSIYMLNSLWIGGVDQPNPLPSTGARYRTLVGVVRYEGRPTQTQGYYLLPRKAADYVVLTVVQASILYGFPIDQTHLAVQFDRAVQQASAETPSHYTTTHGLSVSAAAMDTTRRRVILTTGAQTNGLADTLMVVGVVDSFGVTMTNQDSARIWQGFTPLAQAVRPKSPTNDTCQMANEIATFRGVIVADSSAFYYSNMYLNDNSDSINNGIQLYLNPGQPWLNGYWPVEGDTIVATGVPFEYFNETELNYVVTYKNLYLINHGPAPVPTIKSDNAATFLYSSDVNLHENYEGVLAKLCDSLVAVAWGLPDTFTQKLYSLSTGDTIAIEAQPAHMNYPRLTAGTRVDGLTGVVRYRRGFWRIAPRDALDFNTGLDCGGTPPLCDYLIGDFSGDGNRMGADVTFGVRYFKGLGATMPDSCYNDSVNTTRGHWLYVAADCNGDCNQSGADITRLVAYFKGTAHLSCCRFFPTALPPLIRPVGSDHPALKD